MRAQWHIKFAIAALFALLIATSFAQSPQVTVKSVGMTVSDMDRSMAFYSELAFQKVSDVEVLGEQYEHLEGVFGARMRIVRMQLGNEYLDLTEYLTPRGRLIPADSRSNDLWFQHIAIVVRDMDQAFEKLRALKVQFVSTGPQTYRHRLKPRPGLKRFIFAIRISITWKSFIFRRARAIRAGRRRPISCSLALIILRLGFQT